MREEDINHVYHIQQNKTNHRSVSHGHKIKQQQEDRQTDRRQAVIQFIIIYLYIRIC